MVNCYVIARTSALNSFVRKFKAISIVCNDGGSAITTQSFPH